VSVAEALALAAEHFPRGAEELAARLGVEVRYSPLCGCDGWSLPGAPRPIIRINSKTARSRQRFTLAHELGHLVLGVPSVVGQSSADALRCGDPEERRVDDFAAQLLIPTEVVQGAVAGPPIDTAALRRLARRARVSQLAVALRVADLAPLLGLQQAAVLFFEQDALSWQWSPAARIDEDTACEMLASARRSAPRTGEKKSVAFRSAKGLSFRGAKGDNPKGDHHAQTVVSLIENPWFGSATLLVQRFTVSPP
jgi:hypothetical protein